MKLTRLTVLYGSRNRKWIITLIRNYDLPKKIFYCTESVFTYPMTIENFVFEIYTLLIFYYLEFLLSKSSLKNGCCFIKFSLTVK